MDLFNKIYIMGLQKSTMRLEWTIASVSLCYVRVGRLSAPAQILVLVTYLV